MVFDRNRPRAQTNGLLAEIVRRQAAIRVDPSNARIHSLANTAPRHGNLRASYRHFMHEWRRRLGFLGFDACFTHACRQDSRIVHEPTATSRA